MLDPSGPPGPPVRAAGAAGLVLGMEVSNSISAAFVGQTEDEQVAADALRMLRVPTGRGYEAVLGGCPCASGLNGLELAA